MSSTIYIDNFVADVKCYHCASIVGRLRSEELVKHQPALFQPEGEKGERSIERWQTLRCQRCGGPVYLDEAEIVRRRIERFDLEEDRPRRGRPPKHRPATAA